MEKNILFLTVGIVLLCIRTFSIYGQTTEGKITFERKINLQKKFENAQSGRNKIAGKNKYRIDTFELVFNDSLSIFSLLKPDEIGLMESAISKNTIYQNFNTEVRYQIIDVFGEKIYILDSLKKRNWKITEDKRIIANYECRKAIWFVDKNTRIYAWYTDEIVPLVGPETYTGLPGGILGVALEDGSETYFATSIVQTSGSKNPTLFSNPHNVKYTTENKLIEKLKRLSNNLYLPEIIKDLIIW